MRFDFLNILIVLGVAASIAYKVSFFHNKRLSYLSLVQVLYLIVFPGIILPSLFNYMLSIRERPLVENAFISDKVLMLVTLTSLFFGYGGIAIHSVTKMIYRSIEESGVKLSQDFVKMTQFFHLTFSHNLLFSGMLFSAIGGVLLEINHVPVDEPVRMMSGVIKGSLLGVSLLMGLFSYNPADDGYGGRWSDLKYVFMTLWVGLVLLLYGIRKTKPVISEYELLLPVLVSVIMLFSLSVFLVYRASRTGGLRREWLKMKANVKAKVGWN